MTDYIVFKKGAPRPPKNEEFFIGSRGNPLQAIHDISEQRIILEQIPDAEVEALEARLRPVFRDPTWACAECGWVSNDKQTIVGRDGEPAQCPECASTEVVDSVKAALLSAVAGRDEEKARAEKAEAERDELRAKVKEDANDLLCTQEALCEARNERDRAQSEAQAQAEIAKSFVEGRAVEIEDDTRARFERDVTRDSYRRALTQMHWTANDLKESGLTYVQWCARQARDEARVLADAVFGPSAGKGEGAAVAAPPQFKVGDRVTNPKGRCGKVVALYPDQTLDLRVIWDGDPHSCYEMSRELRPAPADPAPPAPWTPKKGDVVYVPRAEWTVDAAHPGDAFVVRRHSNEALCKFADLELVRRSQEAKS